MAVNPYDLLRHAKRNTKGVLGVVRHAKAQQAKPDLIRLPRLFYDDHVERIADADPPSPTPEPVRQTKNFVWVPRNADFSDLISDAHYYEDADKQEGWDEGAKRYGPAARRVLAALAKAGVKV